MKILKIHALEKGWCDKDHVMLHAAFQILVDFVENERPGETCICNTTRIPLHSSREASLELKEGQKPTLPSTILG